MRPRTAERSRTTAEVDALLDWLEANGFLSDERFVESRVHAREARFGNLRIRSELAQHGVALPAERLQALGESELARAGAVRERRFAAAPRDAAERAAPVPLPRRPRVLARGDPSPDAPAAATAAASSARARRSRLIGMARADSTGRSPKAR